eukprot:414914_1
MIFYESAVLIGLLISLCKGDYSPWSYGNDVKGFKWFKQAKLGLFICYSPITQWGDDLSFPLVCEQLPCTVQSVNHTVITINTIDELIQHRQNYYNLMNTFNPTLFNASNWVSIAKQNGFKYILFTAIHCDGFANWNSQLTDYNIMNSPFNRDLFGELVEASRASDIKIGAYICPSFWNNNNYWSPDAMTALAPSCFPNYDPLKNTNKWNIFIKFLHNISLELLNNYNPDLYWYDCWNSPPLSDTYIDDILPQLRASNNGNTLILNRNGVFSDYYETADRDIYSAQNILGDTTEFAGGYFEVPDLLQLSGQWAYDPTSGQKNASLCITNLISLVSKGGNYLLNISPKSDGTIPDDEITVVGQIGEWMKINGEAIYNSTPCYPYQWFDKWFNSIKPCMYITSNDNKNVFIFIPSLIILPDNKYIESKTFKNDIKLTGILYVPWIRKNLLKDSIVSIYVLGINQSLNYTLNSTGLYIKNPQSLKSR